MTPMPEWLFWAIVAGLFTLCADFVCYTRLPYMLRASSWQFWFPGVSLVTTARAPFVRRRQRLKAYRGLADGVSDMVEGGRLTRVDVPDDYEWVVTTLIDIAALDPGPLVVYTPQTPYDANDLRPVLPGLTVRDGSGKRIGGGE